MANGDGVVSYQDIFHYEPYDALAFRDTQCISSAVEPREERGEHVHAGVVQAYAPATVRST